MTSKRKDPEEGPSTVKIIGRTLEVLALPILIIVAVLMNMEEKNLGIIGLLLGFGSCMVILGIILSHLPQGHPQEKTTNKTVRRRKNAKQKLCS